MLSVAKLLEIKELCNAEAERNEEPEDEPLAVMGGHHRVTGLLIKSGADLNLKDKEGVTALMWAAMDRATPGGGGPGH